MKNYSLKSQYKSICYEYDYLNTFIEEIIALRKSLLVFSEKLPKSLGKIVVAHYKNRLYRAKSLPMLGEYVVYLIGDLFKIPVNIINQLSFPWLLLYEYCLLIDDIIDNPIKNNSKEYKTSQILLKSALKEYNNNFKNDISLVESFGTYHRQWFDAMIFELNQNFEIDSKVTDVEFLQQGRKSALVKFCADSLVRLNNKRSLNPIEEKCLDNFCSGIQLLDDVTDIEQDYTLGVSNTIIKDMYQWIEKNHIDSIVDIKNLSTRQLKIILIFSGAISDSLKLASNYLSEGINLSNNPTCITTKYFHQVIKKCVTSIRIINEYIIPISLDKVLILLANDELEKNNIYRIDSQKISEIWEDINLLIYNIPKACN